VVKVIAALAGRCDFAAAEQLAVDINGKAARAEALTQIAAAKERGGGTIGEPFPGQRWDNVLADAESKEHPDERLNRIAEHVAFHPYPKDGRKTVAAALLHLREALAGGDDAIRAAGLSPEGMKSEDCPGQLKGRRKREGAASEYVQAARLCRIAEALGTLGDFAAGAETAARIHDEDFRASALALALSGYFEFQERLRHDPKGV
jgi:hypothetical protein